MTLTPIHTSLIKELREAKEEVDADPDGNWPFVHLDLAADAILHDADRSQP